MNALPGSFLLVEELWVRRGERGAGIFCRMPSSGVDQGAEGEIGVRGGVGGAKLDVELRRDRYAWCLHNRANAQAGLTITKPRIAPSGAPAMRDEPQVGDDAGRGHRTQCRRMAQDAGDKAAP